ncbi:FkbM family methyltransferase [Rhodoligotrophos defluvii]|uniref:FkbM family methyltransferase n=1 Tax=Rhodoligotrophos defluvii TaxID=2561934 RepID=UPI0010C9B1FC|nr:FkbM family methyltransferase [Rhodoligotrophos defluvii]
MLSRLPIISALAAYVLSLFAAYAPGFARRGKIFRLIALFCDGHVVRTRYGVRMHVNRKDRTNQFCILGTYDNVAREIDKLSPGMCFIDIGANAGLFTLMAAERVGPDGVVIAFEPSPEQYGYLVRNIRANGVHNVLPLQLAVTDRTERVAFSAHATAHSGRHHIRARGEEGSFPVFGVRVAEDFTAAAAFCGRRKTMIKIDVEGFELQVVQGIRQLIQQLQVVSAIIEVDAGSLGRYGSTPEALYAELAALGLAASSKPTVASHYDEVFVRKDLAGTWERRPDAVSLPTRAAIRATHAGLGQRVGWLAGSVAAAYALVLAFVAVVDPYGVTEIVSIPGINAQKTQRLEGGGRVEKSLALWREDHDAVILGSTSALMGINPDSPAFAGLNAYNAAIPGATMAEIHAVGQFLLNHGRPKVLVIGLEFSMFEADRTIAKDFEQSGFDGDWMPAVYARALGSPQALIDALQTVYHNMRGVPERTRDDGFQGMNKTPDFDYREAFTEILAREFLVRDWHYADFDYDPGRVRLLADLLQRFGQTDTQVRVFVSPIHARQLEAIVAKGIYPVYETWLRDLAAVADANAQAEIWDFSGYNSVTTEEVPDWGDKRQDMMWYWNSARYTPATGEVMIASMLGATGGAVQPLPGFGRPLSVAGIERILEENRAGRQAYSLAHGDEVADVERLVREAAAKLSAHSM